VSWNTKFMKYLWNNSDSLNECWDLHFSAGKTGPPGQGRHGFDQHNNSIEELQAILWLSNSPWVSLFRSLGIPRGVQLKPGGYCKIPTGEHYRHEFDRSTLSFLVDM